MTGDDEERIMYVDQQVAVEHGEPLGSTHNKHTETQMKMQMRRTAPSKLGTQDKRWKWSKLQRGKTVQK